MRVCPNCKSKFIYKDRLKVLRDKNKILECRSCGFKYSQSLLSVKISFWLSVIVYVIFNNNIYLFLGNWIYSNFIREILNVIIGIVWIIACVYVSQFYSIFKKYE